MFFKILACSSRCLYAMPTAGAANGGLPTYLSDWPDGKSLDSLGIIKLYAPPFWGSS